MRTQVIISFLILFLLSITISSQTYIWGGPGDVNSEFAYGLNDWTVNSISPNDSAIWAWEADGKADRGAYSGASSVILSPSVGNGAAVFDSDYYDNAGTQGNFGNGPAAAPQLGELISPEFSTVGENSVWLKFNQSYRHFTNSVTKINISIDGGATWGSDYIINKEVAVNSATSINSEILLNISDQAADQAKVKFKFVFDANYYYWIIDEVYVVSNPPGDAQIIGTWFPPNRFNTPLFCIDNDSMKFKMDIVHKGGHQFMDLEGRVTLINTDNYNIHFTDTTYFDLIFDDTATVSFKSFMPEPNLLDTGLYVAIYEIFTEDDFATSDNKSYYQYFRISDYMLYAEDLPVSTKWEYTICDIIPDYHFIHPLKHLGKPISDIYHFNYYKTGNWTLNNSISIRAYYANLGVRMNTDNSGSQISYPVTIFVFEGADTLKNDLSNLNPFDGIIIDGYESSQFEYIGYAAENVENTENSELLEVRLFSADDEEGYINLKPDKKYFIAAQGFGYEKSYHTYDNHYNGIKRFYYEDQNMSFIYADFGDGPRFQKVSKYIGAWQMGFKTRFVLLAHENTFPESTLQILQNPVINNLKIHIDFENIIKKGTIAIYSLNGDIINMRNIHNFKNGTLEFGVNYLPKGVYFITLFTKDKLITKKFIVQR